MQGKAEELRGKIKQLLKKKKHQTYYAKRRVQGSETNEER